MNEKIEGCRTYEEDDDILLSRSLGKSIFVGLFQEHAFILVLSARMIIIIILPCQSYLFMFKNLVGSFQTLCFV